MERGAGHRWQYVASALHAGYLRLQMNIAVVFYSLLFHYNDGYTTSPQCYVIHTLPVMSVLPLLTDRLTPSNTDVQNAWISTYTFPYASMACYLIKHRGSFKFYPYYRKRKYFPTVWVM